MLNTLRKDIFRRGIVALMLISLIPLTIFMSGYWIVAQYGRVPGGSTTTCERTIDDTISFHIEKYRYQSGLTQFEIQTFSVSNDGGVSWLEIFEVDVQTPKTISCIENIQVTPDDGYLVLSQKSVGISQDAFDWHIHHVCDNPRPTEKRCDEDILNIVEADFVNSAQGIIRIEQSLVDEFGEPVTENGEPVLVGFYHLQTSDSGLTWTIADN